MDEQAFEGLKHYKNTADFRKKYGSTDDEPTLGTFFADIASEGLEAWSNKMDRELIGTIFDPYGIWYVEDKEKANKYDKIKEIDKKRPGLNPQGQGCRAEVQVRSFRRPLEQVR